MLRKNVAGQHLFFVLVNASTGAALTGATVTAVRSIDGAAQAACTGTVSHMGGGQYRMALSQADTNGDNIGYLFTAATAVPVGVSCVLTAADPTDAAGFGLSRMDAAVSTRSTYGGGDTAGTTSLLARLTSERAANLDFLDVAVSSRGVAGDSPGVKTLLLRFNSRVDAVRTGPVRRY